MHGVPHLDESAALLANLDPNPLAILGQGRQTLYGNPAAWKLAGVQDGGQFQGRKIGEVLHCIHSLEAEGCGETPHCRYCGANNAILAGLDGASLSDECRITAYTPGGTASLEFAVHSRPVVWKGENAVFCSLRDISSEKRRKVLEHTFFTDILRTARSLRNLSEILLTKRKDLQRDVASMVETVHDHSDMLLSEIRGQQVLLSAESGQFDIAKKSVSIADCVADAVVLVSHLESAGTKKIVQVYPDETTKFWTDPVLLGQVLTHLLKNALEATLSGGEVRICGRVVKDRAEFSVWNEGFISDETRTQMFQRSFSTKGPGRGIGTYSLRLFAETYLGGKVSYTSSECDGTTFVVSLPLVPKTEPTGSCSAGA